MTLLTTVQSACSLLGLVQPTAVVASVDQQVIQLYGLANEEGDELARKFDWRKLTKEYTFLTTAADVQVGGLPSDWSRFIDGTMYDRTLRRQVGGPLSEQEWQALQAYNVAMPSSPAYRLRGTDFLMTPTPAAGDTVAYEYVSANWVLDVDGVTYKAAYSADNDTALLSERLIALGIRWRFQQAKGLDYAESMRTYGIEVQKAAARDKGMPTLSGGGSPTIFMPYPNIPESNWPGT